MVACRLNVTLCLSEESPESYLQPYLTSDSYTSVFPPGSLPVTTELAAKCPTQGQSPSTLGVKNSAEQKGRVLAL